MGTHDLSSCCLTSSEDRPDSSTLDFLGGLEDSVHAPFSLFFIGPKGREDSSAPCQPAVIQDLLDVPS